MFPISNQTHRKGNPMRARKVLHDLLDNACKSIDKRLLRTLLDAAEALTRCKQLSIASLGRSLCRKAKVKHAIKCMDRLFGNTHLHIKNAVVYCAISNLLIKAKTRPVIIVDWSGLTPCGAFYFLNASVAVNGRAITLYNRAHPLKNYTKEKTHKEFLDVLRDILPKNCKPIIITDAGFRNSWFRAVSKMGWDYIGRVRNSTHYCALNQENWQPIKSLYKNATKTAEYIGQVILAKSTRHTCHFYQMKRKGKNRVKRNLAGKKVQCSVSKKHSRGAKEPWLIASSFSPKEMSAKNIMKLYKTRMQIEEVFRDLKNMQNGLGLRHCRSFEVERLNTALLIGALAMLMLWIVGTATKQKNLHHSYQSNSVKSRPVLSIFSVGCQALLSKSLRFTLAECFGALKYIVSTISAGKHYV